MLSLPDSCICSFTLARNIHKLKQFGNLRLMPSMPLSTPTKVNPLGSVEAYLHEFLDIQYKLHNTIVMYVM